VNSDAPGQCIGHQESARATCPAAAAATDFIYDYEVVAPGTLNSLWAEVSAAPGGITQYTATVLVRRAGVVMTAMSCTITGIQRACETTGSFAVLTGDRVEVRITETVGNPANNMWKTYVTLSST
jgi:hypothetical protein